jgi:hypothetical protein
MIFQSPRIVAGDTYYLPLSSSKINNCILPEIPRRIVPGVREITRLRKHDQSFFITPKLQIICFSSSL